MNQLFRITGFIPFLLIVFVNAFVDLGHKIIIQNTIFKAYDDQTQILLTAVVNALILVPFILLFSPAGWLSDRFAKPAVIRASSALAILITLLITLCYYQGWFQWAFAMTLILAAQSAIYSPAKYGYLREMAGKSELAHANGIIQATTIIAILAGIFAFSILFELQLTAADHYAVNDILMQIASVGWILVALTVLEFLLACRLYQGSLGLADSNPTSRFDWTAYVRGQTLNNNLQTLFTNKAIWLSIIGLSVFWGISQVLLAAFPAHAKSALDMHNTILVQGLLACSGIGIALGSIIAGRSSHRHIETGLIPLGALGIVLGLILLPQLHSPVMIGLVFAILGCSGGMFIVPLNSLIQFHAPIHQLGTILAGNNWIQNIVMLSFLGLTWLFASQGLDAYGLFLLLTLIAVIGTAYTLSQLPQSFVRLIFSYLFSGLYQIEVLGFENIPSRGAVLLLGNHISWLDWAMVQIACPRKIRFVMHREIYSRWYLKWLMDLAGVVPIGAGNSKASLERINELLQAGEAVCIFPEGAISRNGQLGEFKKGFERSVQQVEGVILPFYLRGLWGSRFSRSNEQLRQNRQGRLRRDIIVAFAEPLPINSDARQVKQAVLELSINAWQQYIQQHEPLALTWFRTAKRQGRSLCMADMQGGTELSGYRALTAASCFAQRIRHTCPEQNIGIMLPASCGGLLTNLGAHLAGKTLVNLNYTASSSALQNAITQAELKTLYTSKNLLSRLAKRGFDADTALAGLQLIYVEDLKGEITTTQGLLTSLAVSVLPTKWLYRLLASPLKEQQPAAILFSSGSEGSPKGVMLNEQNILGNIRQIADVLDTVEGDRIVATLPLFHAFGLTVTGLLPLIEGIPAICHPDPTDSVNIAKGIYRYRASIFCTTSTFLRMFNRQRRIHPLMLDSLRIVVAGAERLAEPVRQEFQIKFNKPIYEGYGTSETTPVASVNVPDRMDDQDWQLQVGSKLGTVGMPLPGSSFRIVDPLSYRTLSAGEDGMILIGGTQVMQGYLNDPERTQETIIELDGKRWYKSGDKGHLDEDGFLTIVDRYSRFAKVAGEMISLSAVEQACASVLPADIAFLAGRKSDAKKGEVIVLLVEGHQEDRDTLLASIKKSSILPIMQPQEIIAINEIPRLGAGKVDFQAAQKMISDGQK